MAESVLGKALKGIARDRYYLSTKVGKYTQPGGYGDDTLVWDNHGCMPLRPLDESFLPQLQRYRAAGVPVRATPQRCFEGELLGDW